MKRFTKKETLVKKGKKKTECSTQSFYIEDRVYELLAEDAEAEERSRSYFLNKLLKVYYQKQGRLKVEAKRKLTRKKKK